MKKTKVLLKTVLVLGLTVVLLVMSVSAPTFSWFTRPQSQSGGSLEYTLPASKGVVAYDGGDVTMTTYISDDDGVNFSETAVDFTIAENRSRTLQTTSPSNRVYYKTVLRNLSGADQNVSLYVKNFSTGSTGTVCIGVNEPIKAFKNYSNYNVVKPSPSKTTAQGDTTKRVYFLPGNNNHWYDGNDTGWSSGSYYVCSGTNDTNIDSNNGSAGVYTQLNKIGSGAAENSYYYADIPADHNKLFIAVENWGGTDYKRTQTFTNLTGDGLTKLQSLLFNLNGTYSSYHNAWSTVATTTGARIASYYSAALIGVNDTIDMSLDSSSYSGITPQNSSSDIAYSSSNTSVATVNSNGVVTGVGAGTATLTYTVTGSHGDTCSKTATITVNAYASENNTIANAPIVTNLLISGQTSNNQNVQEVYWFIQTGDEMYGPASEAARVSFDAVYLGV